VQAESAHISVHGMMQKRWAAVREALLEHESFSGVKMPTCETLRDRFETLVDAWNNKQGPAGQKYVFRSGEDDEPYGAKEQALIDIVEEMNAHSSEVSNTRLNTTCTKSDMPLHHSIDVMAAICCMVP
jgi:hypothetical protein